MQTTWAVSKQAGTKDCLVTKQNLHFGKAATKRLYDIVCFKVSTVNDITIYGVVLSVPVKRFESF